MTEHDLSGAPLLIRDETGAWRTPETSRFDNEGGLQDLVASNPSLLPLVGEGAVAVREFRTASGPLDVCIVDQSGGVTLVECKLASNPEVRRKIVGQMLDYAARIWRLDFADFDERWRNQNGGVGVLDALGLDSTDEVQGTIATALERGEFNLVLAVDGINEPLRHLVEYLNSHTSDSTAVLAVEFRYFRRNDVEVLVPSVYGTESAQAKAGRRRRDAWSVEEYEEYVSVHEPASLSTVRELFNKLVEAGFDLVGSSSATPSLVTRSDWNGRNLWAVRFQTAPAAAEINFFWMGKSVPVTTKAELAEVLAAIPGSQIDPAALASSEYRKKPRIGMDVLSLPGGVTKFMEAVSVLLEE